MKAGAERKKVILLALLVAAAVYLVYTNMIVGEAPPAAARPASALASRPAAPAPNIDRPAPPVVSRTPAGRGLQEFRPSLKGRAGGTATDPVLRLDLLAKVQSVTMAGGERNLFQFGAAPPKTPEPKIVPKPVVGPKPPEAADNKPAEPANPPPPPIPLKFFGYASQTQAGPRRAFFLNGEDIFIAGEGDLIKQRYKIVRIGINSVVVEDVEHKHQQTLPLEQEVS